MSEQNKVTINRSKRSFLRKAAYMAPAVMTLTAMPFSASYGSGQVVQNTPPSRGKPGRPYNPRRRFNPSRVYRNRRRWWWSRRP